MANNVAPLRPTDTKNRELSWFSERVERGRSGPFMEITSVTPTIAARLLEMNDGNRPLNDRLINEIASDIEKGYWELNGETIIVSKEGLLNDGQHRLEAVLKTGKPIETAIVFGMERNSRFTNDMGRQRTTSNFLSMNGVAYQNNIAAVAKALLLYDKGIYGGGGGKAYYPTKQEILDYYGKHKKAIDVATRELINEKFIKSAGSTAFIAAYVILHRANATECGVFFARICDGANLKSTDAVLWLRARFMGEWKKRRAIPERLEMIIQHWNRWRLGTKVVRAIPVSGSYPKVSK